MRSIHQPWSGKRHLMRNFILLYALWLILSGIFEPLFLGLGLFSCALVVWLTTRLVYTRDDPLAAFNLWRLLRYIVWLIGQIVVSSLRVMYLVLHPKLPIDARFSKVRADQSTRIGHVLYANSITLTPGTASVDLDDSHVLVHALEASSITQLNFGEMGRRVNTCEDRAASEASDSDAAPR